MLDEEPASNIHLLVTPSPISLSYRSVILSQMLQCMTYSRNPVLGELLVNMTC